MATQQQQQQPATATPSWASASLYVGELNFDVSEAMLFEIFKRVGPVASIRVCRDAMTRRSLGYAYVNFHNVQDAERALDTLNYTTIGDRPCRIMWSHRDPAKRKSGAGNVFIKNLDKSIDNQNLYDTFSAFGNILSCKVELDESGASKGYGYVHYQTAEEADAAIEKVDGMLLAGTQVSVARFKPKKEREAEKENTYTNVFIKNLPLDCSIDLLKEKFSKFGEIQSAVIMTGRNEEGEEVSRGFGFVNFAQPEFARTAVSDANGDTELFGQELFVSRAQKKNERQQELKKLWEDRKMENMQKYQGVNLYVKNLDDTVDEEMLRKEFSQCGNITSCKIMRDDKDVSRGFGFVCFTTPEEATKGVTEMNGAMIAQKPIYVALAQRKEVRRAQLEQQHAQRMMRMPNSGVNPNMAGYPAGGPMFYPQPGNPRMPMYPNQVPGGMARGGPNRWQPPSGGRAGPAGYQQMPGYVMPGMQRQRQQGPGGRGGARGPPQNGGKRPAGNSGYRGGRGGGVARGQFPPAGGQMAPINPQELAQQSPEEAKMLLGDRLYHLIAKTHKDLAGKITGMLLESMDNTELILLLEDEAALDAKVEEALEVLRKAAAESEGEATPASEEGSGAEEPEAVAED